MKDTNKQQQKTNNQKTHRRFFFIHTIAPPIGWCWWRWWSLPVTSSENNPGWSCWSCLLRWWCDAVCSWVEMSKKTDIAKKIDKKKYDFFVPCTIHYVNFRNLFPLCSVFQFTTNLDSIILVENHEGASGHIKWRESLCGWNPPPGQWGPCSHCVKNELHYAVTSVSHHLDLIHSDFPGYHFLALLVVLQS